MTLQEINSYMQYRAIKVTKGLYGQFKSKETVCTFTLNQSNQIIEIEFAGLQMAMEDLDTGSEDSFGSETEETADLIKKSEPVKPNNELLNGTSVNSDHPQNSTSTEEPNSRTQHVLNDLCDSGIESISNGDTHQRETSPKRWKTSICLLKIL